VCSQAVTLQSSADACLTVSNIKMTPLPLTISAFLLIWISYAFGESVIVLISAFVLFILGMFTTVVLWKRLQRQEYGLSRKLGIAITLACLAIFVSVPITHWPLRLAFKFSRPAFDRIAHSLQSGLSVPQPVRAGLFEIKKAEVYNRKVCLWINLNPNGKTGFTLCPPGNLPFNLWSTIHLDADWQFISED